MKTIKTRLISFTILFLTIILLLPAASYAKSYLKVIAFGDSLSDHYGLQSVIGPYDPVSNPTGALEAWTNGDVWVEYLADILNADLDNNAIAGAMTQGHENDSIQGLSDMGQLPQLGLISQINSFAGEDANFLPSRTLFTIWIGGNDLLKYGRGESDASSVEELITDAIDNIINSMSVLAADGATNILVMNLPDLGKSPAYNTRTPAEIAAVTSLSAAFNSALDTGINHFEKLFPDITVYKFDIFNYLNEIITEKTFANSTGTYMVLNQDGYRTGETNEPAGDYLFWDSIHPMTKAHEIVAVEVADSIADAEDDDDTCFISTASVNMNNNLHVAVISGIFLIFGFAGLLIKKD